MFNNILKELLPENQARSIEKKKTISGTFQIQSKAFSSSNNRLNSGTLRNQIIVFLNENLWNDSSEDAKKQLHSDQRVFVQIGNDRWSVYKGSSVDKENTLPIQIVHNQHGFKDILNAQLRELKSVRYTDLPTSLSLQQIFYGAPGTGKSHRIKEIIKEHGLDEKEQVIRTTFHPDSDYSTFVGCYKPIMKSVPQTYVVEGNEKPVMADKNNQATKDEIVYDYTPQAFVLAYTKAWTTDEPVILVIEEINRGNCAQIFGDIFQLLDRGDDGVSEYEIKPDKALENYLREYFAAFEDVDEQIKSGKIMKLPANLYIWATMNTSDQSLFPIDSAFKRRWEWKYMPINNHENKGYQIEIGNAKYDWWGFLARINHVINDTTNSEDKKLGYFFAKAQGKTIDAEQFVGKVLFYLWNDVFKNYGFDDPIFSKGDNKKFEFSDFFMNDGNPNTDTVNLFLRKLEETIKMEELPMEIKPNLQDDGQGE